MPGESLFPASLLGSAKLVSRDGTELGTLVDAMLGCRSGRLNYLVVAEGGVAGVGETLRRVDWQQAAVDGDRLSVGFDAARFGALPKLARDDWPGR
jgi:sporulation protein YlmC with PRC-barrel domain